MVHSEILISRMSVVQRLATYRNKLKVELGDKARNELDYRARPGPDTSSFLMRCCDLRGLAPVTLGGLLL